MKKVSLLKTMLLLFALIAGSSSAWATDITYTFTSKSWEATVGEEEANWTSGKDGYQMLDGRGVQITASVSGANGTSPTSLSNISKIVVTYSTNATKGEGSISFQIGSGTVHSQDVTKTGGTTDRTLTYNISPEETGKVKMTVTCTTNSIYVKSVTITYSEGAPKSPNELAWSAASKDVTYSETPYNLPTLSNPHSLAIEYSSSNTDVATINSTTGEVTIKNYTGSTTISAYTDGDETYAAGTVSYTLNVTKIFIVEDGVFDFSYGPSNGGDYGSGVTTTTSSSEYVTEAKTWIAGNVTMVTDGKYRWWNNDMTLRFYNNDPQTSATFSVPDGYVIVKIAISGGTGFSSTPDGLTSGTWTGASQTVKFEYDASISVNVKKFTVTYLPENVTIAPAKEYTTYVTPGAMNFTGVTGLKAYVATAADASGVTLVEPTAAVPANTPLVLKKESGSSFDIPVVASASAPATNLLKAGPATLTGDGTEYILVDGLFYKATAGSLAAGKAYLKLASALGRELVINWGDETAIQSIDNGKLTMDNVIYDLQGRRVENPTKGIFIINGKKVVIK